MEEQTHEIIKLEIMSDSDLYFFFINQITDESFQPIKEQLQLHVDFNEYPPILVQNFTKAIKDHKT